MLHSGIIYTYGITYGGSINTNALTTSHGGEYIGDVAVCQKYLFSMRNGVLRERIR